MTTTKFIPTQIPEVATTQSTFIAGENITAGNALRLGKINASDVGITQISGGGDFVFGTSGTQFGIGQSFKTLTLASGFSKYILSKIVVSLKKSGTPTDNIVIGIYENDKTTLIGTSTTTLSGTLFTTSYIDYTFNFNNLELNPTTTYFIRYSRSGSADNSNYYLSNRSTSNVYGGGGIYVSTDLISWDGFYSGLYDLYFNITLEQKSSEDTSKAYKTDASSTSKINFIGFATNTVSTGGNVVVDTSGVSNTQSGLTAGSDYYLTNIPGAISTTPGTNIVSVGKAVSNTGIEINTNYKKIINQTSLFTTLNVSRNTAGTTTSSTYKADNDYFATFQNNLYCAGGSYTATTTIQYSTDGSTWINIANNNLSSPSISGGLTNNYISSVYLLKGYYYRTTAYATQSTNATSEITLVNLIKI